MKLVFQIFDFDQDGKISAEDVRLVLSYIPFRRCKRSSLSLTEDGPSSNGNESSFQKNKKVSQEGLYSQQDGKDMNEEERGSNVKKINQFVSLVFSSKSNMNLTEFTDFNSSVSSEMFISVIGILHERLPCSQFVFRSKKKFKYDECQKALT